MINQILSCGERFIPWEEQGKCSYEGCDNPRTHSCTDSILVHGERKESMFRHGCDNHPVESMRELADGTWITWKAYAASL